MIQTEMKTFEVKSGKICITDPCYKRGTWCAIMDIPAKNGVWIASIETSDEDDWGMRVSTLRAHHVEHNNLAWNKINSIGVDSGQAGIFDSANYPDNPSDYGDKSAFDDSHFYGRCCNTTCYDDSSICWGIVDGFGVVSSSGYGDGSYSVYVDKNNENEITAVKIVFISPDEDDDSEEDEDDWDQPL
jgi:hypothetical protein